MNQFLVLFGTEAMDQHSLAVSTATKSLLELSSKSIEIAQLLTDDPDGAWAALKDSTRDTNALVAAVVASKQKLLRLKMGVTSIVLDIPAVLLEEDKFEHGTMMTDAGKYVRQLFWTLWHTNPIQGVKYQPKAIVPGDWMSEVDQSNCTEHLTTNQRLLPLPPLALVNGFRYQIAQRAPATLTRAVFCEGDNSEVYMLVNVSVN